MIGSAGVLLLPAALLGGLIDALQERGRPLLLFGTAVLLLVIGAALGVAMARWAARPEPHDPTVAPSRRGSWWLRWLVPALGLWLLTLPLVALSQGGIGNLALASTASEWLLISGLLELGLSQGPAAEARVPAGRPLEGRRRFLALAGGVAGAAALGLLGAGVLEARSPGVGSVGSRLLLGRGGGELPPAITSTSDFYVVSKDLFGPPRVDPGTWRLTVAGGHPLELSYSQLEAEPAIEQVQTLECISNPVGGTLISNGRWRGTMLGALLTRAHLPSDTEQVVFYCADGYTESLPLAVAMRPDTLVAYRLNDQPLPAAHGFPARLLVPGHYGMKNPKWLTAIDHSRQPYLGYWEQQGWNAGAIPKLFSRFDFPRGNATLVAGADYLLTGVAYGGSRGIGGVEVSFDSSSRWLPARLAPPLSPYSWTIWSLSWRPATGLYNLTVRARDLAGEVQRPGSGSSYPNGAAGLESQTVVVR